MHSDVINDYLNRDVEVSTSSSKTFTGNLKLHDSAKEFVVLDPKQDKYSCRRYGEVVIRQHDIVSIREVLPSIEEDLDDDDDDEDYKMKSDSRDLSSIFTELDGDATEEESAS